MPIGSLESAGNREKSACPVVSVAVFTGVHVFPCDKSVAIANINCYERGRRTKYTDVNIPDW